MKENKKKTANGKKCVNLKAECNQNKHHQRKIELKQEFFQALASDSTSKKTVNTQTKQRKKLMKFSEKNKAKN